MSIMTVNESIMIENILNKSISYQENVWSPLGGELNIRQALDKIKNMEYSSQISELRDMLNSGNKKGYDDNKKRLPAVTFCGTFNANRKKEFLKEYNEIIIIDIDKLEEMELKRVKSLLDKDNYVLSYWESPSGMGIKGIVAIKYNHEKVLKKENIDLYHKYAFKQLVNYFRVEYSIDLDISGSDLTRLCFFSCDPHIVLKSRSNYFEVNDAEIQKALIKNPKQGKHPLKGRILKHSSKKHLLLNPNGKNMPGNRNKIQSIIKYLSKRKISITESYNEWYHTAYAIADTFTHDVGEKYYLKLCKLDGEKYNGIDSRNMLVYCYENSRGDIKFSTILFYAQRKGYKKKGKVGGSTEAV